jgi:hypothetical protein
VEIEWSDDRDEHGKQTAGLAVAWHVMQSRSFFFSVIMQSRSWPNVSSDVYCVFAYLINPCGVQFFGQWGQHACIACVGL